MAIVKNELAYLLVAHNDLSAKEAAEAFVLVQVLIHRMDLKAFFLDTRALAYLALKKMPQAR